MSQITNHKCPACTGPLHFVGSTNKVECDYCGSTYTIEEIDKLYEEEVKKQAEEAKNSSETESENQNIDEGGNLQGYNCPSCGAELFCDAITVATSCPYCGNPTVIPKQFKGGKMPDFVIPFKIDKENAVKALKKFYEGKKLLPNCFSEQNHLEEIKGVYVPFWLYDGVADADVTFEGTTSSSVVSGNKRTITTKYFDIKRKGSVELKKVPVDASIKMDNDMMDSLEPFDYEDLKDFTASYLPGYFAEAYDESPDDCFPRVKKRAETTALDVMKESVHGYETLHTISSEIDFKKSKAHYAFFPVWILATKWQDKVFQFVMNGQTGKFVGKLPMDKGKYWKYFFKRAGILSVIFCTVWYLFVRFF